MNDLPSNDKTRNFYVLYKQYFNPLLNFGLQLCNDKLLVEDILQNIFLWLYEHPEKMSQIEQIEVYLFVTTKKNIQSALSRMQRSEQSFLRYIFRNPTNPFEKSIEMEIVSKDKEMQLTQVAKKAYQNLPPQLKEVIYLRYFAGF